MKSATVLTLPELAFTLDLTPLARAQIETSFTTNTH